MEERSGLLGRIEQTWSRLSQRERRLAMLWLVAMGFMLTFVVGFKSWNAITDSGDQVEENKATLDLISRKRATYLAANGTEGQESLKNRIETNELKLTTFIDKEASKFDLKPDNFKESSAPASGSKKKAEAGTLMEESVNVTIRNAEYDKVARLLDAIKRSRELLVIKRVEINRRRRARDQSTVDVTLVISTFKTKQEG